MNVEFVRFKATDDLELQGWLTDPGGDTAVIHIHGMSGNGYENSFLDNFRDFYTSKGIAFFAINTRGKGIISDFRQGEGFKRAGSCFELFDESIYDIQGAIQHLQSIGIQKKHFILQGHSLGCTKVVNYWLTKAANEVASIILLAPTDMVGLAKTDPRHDEYLAKAKSLLSEGNGDELVGAQCWLDKTPLSAQTYPTICEAGSSADIYGEREDRSLLGRVGVPTLIVYGTEDIGIQNIDGSIKAWQERTEKIKNPNTRISIIDGAYHSFINKENDLIKAVESFLEID